jgi:hypothetical protein
MAVQPLPPKGNDAVRFAFSHKSGKQDWCAHDIVRDRLATVVARNQGRDVGARCFGYFSS